MADKAKILIIEDDVALRETFSIILSRRHYLVEGVGRFSEALKRVQSHAFDLILLDLTLPDGSGLDILKNIGQSGCNRVVVISGTGTIQVAVDAMKMGVSDYLVKPVTKEILLAVIRKSLETNRKLDDYYRIKEELLRDPSFKKIVHKSRVMKQLLIRSKAIAASDNAVLIRGETGTGKELLARAIHNSSQRKDKPMIAVNCATISEQLAESELFGFEKGAFTGADTAYQGKFRLADGGTIFLDEISELPLTVQAKLLRVLESGEIFPLKGKQPSFVDVRVISATNQNLNTLIRKRLFREDLFYRIEQLTLHIPPLRERRQDIIPLSHLFLKQANVRFSAKYRGLEPRVEEVMSRYNWPGNVRELKNTITEMVTLGYGDVLRADLLPAKFMKTVVDDQERETLKLKHIESDHIEKVLLSTGFNIKKSAELLGISRPTLYQKIKEYSIGSGTGNH